MFLINCCEKNAVSTIKVYNLSFLLDLQRLYLSVKGNPLANPYLLLVSGDFVHVLSPLPIHFLPTVPL